MLTPLHAGPKAIKEFLEIKLSSKRGNPLEKPKNTDQYR